MSSNIIFENIDEQYPVAGIDNDSQGFRDNFSIIKNSLGVAKEEISTLIQTTAKVDADNNFKGSAIQDAEFQNCTVKFFNAGTTTSGIEINYKSGQYQTLNLVDNGSVGAFDITLFGFPEQNRHASMRLQLRTSAGFSKVTFVANGGTVLFDITSWPESDLGKLTISEDRTVVEFWTNDGGNTVFAKFIGEFAAVNGESSGE